MTQEEINLLKKDLSSRIPYGLKIQIGHNWYEEKKTTTATMRGVNGNFVIYDSFVGEEEASITKVKPYLRPLSSMTKEEREYIEDAILPKNINIDSIGDMATIKNEWTYIPLEFISDYMAFLVEGHFDYNGLIPIGLAIEATNEYDN